jgi:hypothetical protein
MELPVFPAVTLGEGFMSSGSPAASEKGHAATKFFGELANRTSQAAGRASTFMLAAAIVIVWAVTGPLFSFSDTLATRHQYRHHDRNVPYGLSYTELPKSG